MPGLVDCAVNRLFDDIDPHNCSISVSAEELYMVRPALRPAEAAVRGGPVHAPATEAHTAMRPCVQATQM